MYPPCFVSMARFLPMLTERISKLLCSESFTSNFILGLLHRDRDEIYHFTVPARLGRISWGDRSLHAGTCYKSTALPTSSKNPTKSAILVVSHIIDLLLLFWDVGNGVAIRVPQSGERSSGGRRSILAGRISCAFMWTSKVVRWLQSRWCKKPHCWYMYNQGNIT